MQYALEINLNAHYINKILNFLIFINNTYSHKMLNVKSFDAFIQYMYLVLFNTLTFCYKNIIQRIDDEKNIEMI